MRVKIAGKTVRGNVRIVCKARQAAVSVWIRDKTGIHPFVPDSFRQAAGAPQILRPLFKRFEESCELNLKVLDKTEIVIMQEVDVEDDLKKDRIKVRIVNGKFGEALYQIRRRIGNKIRSYRRRSPAL